MITGTRYSDDFLEHINMLWSNDIVGFEDSMNFSNTKIGSTILTMKMEEAGIVCYDG